MMSVAMEADVLKKSRRLSIALLCLGTIFFQAGCVPPSRNAAEIAAPETIPADPVLLAVASGSPGHAQTVASPQGGSATIYIKTDYISAAGQECRGYVISGLGTGDSNGLACTDGMAWRKIPPLLSNLNPG